MPARRTPRNDDTVPHLREYGEKRDFTATPEPAPHDAPPQVGPLTFVVQKHRATALHYDLRLEVDGVMKSWPVPKGPSADPTDRRLAVMTEDHPLDYATFEGVIPAGQYGAGEVIVWDRGTYSPDEDGVLSFDDVDAANRRMRAAIEGGKVSVHLRGERMKGSWALVHTTGGDRSWLLLKHRDEAADDGSELTAHDTSVLSGITIADLQAGRRVPEQPAPPLRPPEVAGARRGALAPPVRPMQAQLADAQLPRGEWLLEPKLDGVRAIATVAGGVVTITGRAGNAITNRYPALAAALARQPAAEIVLDGEIVAADEHGVPSFELLQRRMQLVNPVEIASADRQLPVTFYAFDLLSIDGIDLRDCALIERKRLLRSMVLPSNQLRVVEPIDATLDAALDAVEALGLEGLVAKRADSRYEAGQRSAAWRKVKLRRTGDFLVVGFTEGTGERRATFGSLALAVHEGRTLRYVGQVGTGFDANALRALRKHLDTLVTKQAARLTAAESAPPMTRVRPALVVEVAFAEATSGGQLRAPVFLRARTDKPATDVTVAEIAVSRPAHTDIAPAANPIADVLRQLDAAGSSAVLHIGADEVRVANLDRELWPVHDGQPAVTKRDLLRYYTRMSPYLLPQLRDRPLTLTRYPRGINGTHFYQKHLDDLPGPFVETVEVYSEGSDSDTPYILVNNLPTLLWLGQIADLALHTTLARVSPEPDGRHLSRLFDQSRDRVEQSLLNYPDFLLFDLDPYIYAGTEGRGEEPELNRRAFAAACEAATALHGILESIGLASFVKTSGATGLHIYVPVLRQYDYATIRGIAHTIGGHLVRAKPSLVTMEWPTERRRGHIFLDANQNARTKNLACAYSPRAKPGAPVSMPLRWNELGGIYPTDYTIWTAPDRVDALGDLWVSILDAKQDLSARLGL